MWPNVTSDHGYLVIDAQLEAVLSARTISDVLYTNGTAGLPTAGTGTNSSFLCDYVLFTAATNFYMARFMPVFTKAMRNGIGLIGCDFISPYFIKEGLGYTPGLDISRYGRNQQYFASFSVGHMDLGAMILQTQALRKLGVRFCVDKLRNGQAAGCEFVADGLISQRLLEVNTSSLVIPEVLFVKQ